jgi:hypothetical protein
MFAWRPLALIVLGLALAFIKPGVAPDALAADKDNGSISGTVVVEGGGSTKPVANAEIRLTFGSKSDARKSGADGKFTFGDLLPGKYTLRVMPPDGLRPKGDGTVTVTVDSGDSEQVTLVMIAAGTPTPTATSTPAKTTATPSPSPKPVSNQSPSSNQTSGGAMPALVIPFPSPVTAQPSPAGQQARANPAASQQQSAIAAAIGIASPGPLELGSSSLIFGSASPTPQASPTGTRAPTTSPDDLLASGPPRRLITSFEALRATTSGGTAAQLKSWATDTSLVLGVPFKTQIDGTSFSLVNCGPASLAMVLIAFGMDVDPPSVRDYLNYKIGNFDTEQGTSLYVLAQIAREAGLSTFGTSAGLQGWTVNQVREQVRAGHPVITLTKYRRLPGHFGSTTDFDHYIVITGLAGDDFVYNDAAYSTEYGYNLLITPAQLERAWADSSVPRHAVAIGFGDSLKPLPIVPHRLTAESLAASVPIEAQDVQAVAEAPIHINRGPAAEWLREQMLDRLGARTGAIDGETTTQSALAVPPTRLDPSEAAAVEERPAGLPMGDVVDRALAEAAIAAGAAPDVEIVAPVPYGPIWSPDVSVAGIADARAPSSAVQAAPASDMLPTGVRPRVAPPAVLMPLGLTLMGLGLLLTMGGSVLGWRRGEHPAWATRTLASCDDLVVRATRLIPSGPWSARLPGAWTSRLAPVRIVAREQLSVAAARLAEATRRIRPTQ